MRFAFHLAIAISSLLALGRAQQPNLPAEVAAAPCGTLRIPAGTYTIDSPIVKARCITLVGDGMETKVLFGGTGPAVIVGDRGSRVEYPIGGIQDLTLVGPGHSSETVGVWLGGGANGSGLGQAVFADSQFIRGVRITGFGVGIEWGSNAWINTVDGCLIFGNGVGITVAPGATNLTEENRVIDSAIFNNIGPGVADASAADLVFVSTSFDYNSGPAISNTNTLCVACHLESASAPLIDDSLEGAIRIFGGTALLNSSGGDAPALFAAGPNTTQVLIQGLAVWSDETVDSMLSGRPSGPVALSGITGNGNHAIRNLVSIDVGRISESGDLGFGSSDGNSLNTGAISAQSVNAGEVVAKNARAGTISALTVNAGAVIAKSTSAESLAATSLSARVVGASSLSLGESKQTLNTTDQTGTGALVMSTAPELTGASLFNPSIGGGQAVPRMVFAGEQAALPRIRPGKCYDFELHALGAMPGDVAFASPSRSNPSAADSSWEVTWSAAVELKDTITVEACNPTQETRAPTDYYWSAWAVGGYPPPPHKSLGPRRAGRRHPRSSRALKPLTRASPHHTRVVNGRARACQSGVPRPCVPWPQ